MGQYNAIKAKYPDAVLLFRVGDFYETFADDAIIASKVLGIVLTARNNGGDDTPLAGFPHHSIDVYLPKLVKAGYRVAICDQLEKPNKENKIVKRGVTELVTPGLVSNDHLLQHNVNNFLASIVLGNNGDFGLSLLDITTGEFLIVEGKENLIEKLLQNYQPSEIILPKNSSPVLQALAQPYYYYFIEDWVYLGDFSEEKLLNHFGTTTLKGFGIEEYTNAKKSAGVILHYLETTQNKDLAHITRIARIHSDDYVWLDKFTVRNLELIESNHPNGSSLLKVMDHTMTPMGGRLMRKWVNLPLLDKKQIEKRLNVVQYFQENQIFFDDFRLLIKKFSDFERLLSKVIMSKISPKELLMLANSLQYVHQTKQLLGDLSEPTLLRFSNQLNPCTDLYKKILETLDEEAPNHISKGGAIKDGIHEELDDYRNIIKNSKQILLAIEQKEIEQTGIQTLKIGYNNVFGYFFNVTNRYKDQDIIPPHWVRKQTLANAERYVTDELKTIETKILNAEEIINNLETEIFELLLSEVLEYIEHIQLNASIVAILDCLASFAHIAQRNNYRRPIIDDEFVLDIKSGRHPVIESSLPEGISYIPNDVFLDKDDQQIIIITGPNMSGKSAVLRQTAIISLMAQMGSFVPADYARVGILDKVFTRVGASDNISSGESTFMVEMNETASIMNNISDRSLVLLDEIGRGTSTFDGISIAWAIVEYLQNNPNCRPKTLFATHYHELNELATKYDRIHNFFIDSKEIDGKIIFLRKLIAGDSQHSFGIQVARMAGLPHSIIHRASEILKELETKSVENNADVKSTLEKVGVSQPLQLSFFGTDDPKIELIKKTIKYIDINAMTPIECMIKLQEIKALVD